MTIITPNKPSKKSSTYMFVLTTFYAIIAYHFNTFVFRFCNNHETPLSATDSISDTAYNLSVLRRHSQLLLTLVSLYFYNLHAALPQWILEMEHTSTQFPTKHRNDNLLARHFAAQLIKGYRYKYM
ncbi:hypothetical protein NXS19_010533 [Fusarium pseudograminearum]|nr:hypothetical protein NXS19_010533 [Fusarium pseudograminearum]